ncbi:peptidoglycan DD-metalloendopeptidase family protein [Rhodococcus sp. SORGH_AS_0301]|uniref:peptidoglycan DD-metalloendopeptidase family protein n=1 Tax=Rhodococcus sp. SORGH_AS_0301 TaxID=3041780 RepID=UPI002787A9BD|nr:peptidoglycan DD-metalloendopeptidase family protein [Rhodococcus sp. SORGH_AS_0301]MDQ1178636.1 cell wall-associated NlpC family hydrolase [Rhodococcus sp. SORGH_AS_0301]
MSAPSTATAGKAIAAGISALLVLVVAVVVVLARTDDPCAPPTAGGSGSGQFGAGALVKPTDPAQTTLTSGFGPRDGTAHQGTDYAGPVGTPIYAYTDGTVREAGPADGFGNWIVLDHRIDGAVVSTVYGHMSSDGVLVTTGEQVTAGQEIGLIGNAGQSTGPHLHFEIWDGGRLPDGAGTAVDPAPAVDAAVPPGSAPPPAPATAPDSGASPESGGTSGLGTEQLALAKQTVAIGEAMAVPQQGIVVALATQSRESTFQLYANSNVPDSLDYPHDAVGSDHLSVNQFQQQVTIWGDTATLMDPATANRLFYEHLLAVPGWESMPTAVAAQTVQGSDLPDAYAEHESLARTLYAQFAGAGKDLPAADRAALAGAAAAATVGSAAAGDCAGSPSNPNGPTFTPGGPFGANVVAAAMAWLGTPYAWGGGNTDGPTNGISDGGGAADAHGDTGKVGFDCSGLTLYAVFQASGGAISLPHFTGDTSNPGQLYDPRGRDIPLDQKQPGDLIYFGSAGDTHHVGIYYGAVDGTEMLLNAPQSGDVVQVMPLSGWAGEDMYVRRFG